MAIKFTNAKTNTIQAMQKHKTQSLGIFDRDITGTSKQVFEHCGPGSKGIAQTVMRNLA